MGISLNCCKVVPRKLFTNILHRIAFDPLKINIWAWKAFRWFSGSSDPANGVSFGTVLCGGIVHRWFPGRMIEHLVVWEKNLSSSFSVGSFVFALFVTILHLIFFLHLLICSQGFFHLGIGIFDLFSQCLSF